MMLAPVIQDIIKMLISSCHVQLFRSKACSCRVLVDDDKNADGVVAVTLRTSIPPALTGRLTCFHCSSVMLTFVMIHSVRRRLLLMSDSNVSPVQGDERMTCMSFGALHEGVRAHP